MLERKNTVLHREQKKTATTLLSVFSPSTDRFSRFFHWNIQHEIGNKIVKESLKIPSHLKRVATKLCEILMSENYCALYGHQGPNVCYGNQQLLWQKVTIIGFIDLDLGTIEYQTSVAQFRHAVCHHQRLTNVVLVQRKRFASSLNQIKLSTFSNPYQQLSLEWRFASVSKNFHQYQDAAKMISMTIDCAIFEVLNK